MESSSLKKNVENLSMILLRGLLEKQKRKRKPKSKVSPIWKVWKAWERFSPVTRKYFFVAHELFSFQEL